MIPVHTALSHRFCRALLGITLAVSWLLGTGAGAQQPKFFPDDPLQREPETQDASAAREWEIHLAADLLLNLFGRPGDPHTGQRAQNVNTADEVPDSSWFTNRISTRDLSLQEIASGANTIDGPAPGAWIIIGPKTSGVSPGFTIRDEKGERWFLTFDARQYPVAATAAIAVASRLLWALGYNQVETYLTSVRPEQLVIDPGVTIRAHGTERPFTRADLDDVLARSARSADGSYRVSAGRAIPGRPIGGFRFHGTRPDDPNDVVPHEHRRELRALSVFGAWINLVDLKAGNTLDTVVMENGRGVVRHYLQDVGSTFGTGALGPREYDEGYEYLYEPDPLWKRLATLGLFLKRWQTVSYREHPEVGRFEGRTFDPEMWRPRVPVAALRHARADDTLWAALRVTAFSDEQIRAAVRTGAFTDPAAEKLLGDTLIERRDQIGRAHFARINTLVGFALDDADELTFENPAVRSRLAPVPALGYAASWYAFDNATGDAESLGPVTTSRAERLRSPRPLATVPASFVKVSIRALEPAHDPWSIPVDAYFRRTDGGWVLVGVDRMAD